MENNCWRKSPPLFFVGELKAKQDIMFDIMFDMLNHLKNIKQAFVSTLWEPNSYVFFYLIVLI